MKKAIEFILAVVTVSISTTFWTVGHAAEIVLECKGIAVNHFLPDPFKRSDMTSTLIVNEDRGVMGGDIYAFLKQANIPFDSIHNRITYRSEGQLESRFFYRDVSGATKEITTIINRISGDLVIIDNFPKGHGPGGIYQVPVSFSGNCKRGTRIF